jgi:hypothetical protein
MKHTWPTDEHPNVSCVSSARFCSAAIARKPRAGTRLLLQVGGLPGCVAVTELDALYPRAVRKLPD